MQIGQISSAQKQSKHKILHVIIELEKSLENENSKVKIILLTLHAYLLCDIILVMFD